MSCGTFIFLCIMLVRGALLSFILSQRFCVTGVPGVTEERMQVCGEWKGVLQSF